MNEGLDITSYSFCGTLSLANMEHNEQHLLEVLLQTFRKGCSDSKLSVRVQASLALGYLLTAMLPYRRFYADDQLHRVAEPELMCSWVQDAAWLDSFDLCFRLLSDSEKILPSAYHCLSLLAGGLCIGAGSMKAESALTAAKHASLLNSLLDKLMITIGTAADSIEQKSRDVPDKLLMCVMRCLG